MEKHITNGTKIEFLDGYGGKEAGKFTVSQWDAERQRGWAGDKDGRGWYFHAYQVKVVRKAAVTA